MIKNKGKVKYLIIGNSAGGIGAAEAIREVDRTGSILIISDESYPTYSRPLISEYLAEGRPLEKILFRPIDYYEKNNIRTLLSTKVERLNLDEHTVELNGGKKIAWKKLLLASGGLPIIPRIKCNDRSRVFTFTTLDDAKAIDCFLKQLQNKKTRAVVIGGGFIGVSVAEALLRRGVEVTIVEMKERILNTLLDQETSALEEETLKQAGVNIVTGHTVANINSFTEDVATIVTLDDKRKISCNLVIIAIGVLPRTELVSDTDIEINRGILVDRTMATSNPDVYACGDVAEAYDFIYGENRLTPIWPNAYFGGRIAGLNMAGNPTEYSGGTVMNALKYFGLDVTVAGMVNPPDDSYEVLSLKYNDNYRKVVLKDGLVVGMIFTGNIEKSGIVFALMKDKVNINGFKQELIAEDFGLASLPEGMWKPRLEMPHSMPNSLMVSVEQPVEMVMGD